MKRASVIAIALALTACAGTDGDVTELVDVGVGAEVDEHPSRDEYLARLQAEAPEGVEVRFAEPGEVPAYSVSTFVAEGYEPVPMKHYNADGSVWAEPTRTSTEKGRWDCPGSGGTCPCFEGSPTNPSTTKYSDRYGNFGPYDGVCAVPDNGAVTWSAVTRRFMSDIGNIGEFVPLTSVGSVFGNVFSE